MIVIFKKCVSTFMKPPKGDRVPDAIPANADLHDKRIQPRMGISVTSP